MKNLAVKTKGLCSTSVGFQGRDYDNLKFLVCCGTLFLVVNF